MTEREREIDNSADAVGRFGFAPTWPVGFTWTPVDDKQPEETDSEYIKRIWDSIQEEAY